MGSAEGPDDTDLVSEGVWQLWRSLRAQCWGVRCLLSSDRLVVRRFFPDLGSTVGGEARGTDSTEMGLSLYLLSHLSLLPSLPPFLLSFLPPIKSEMSNLILNLGVRTWGGGRGSGEEG